MSSSDWKSKWLLLATMLMIVLGAAESARGAETMKPATAEQLGFAGTDAEIREQAAEVGTRGSWEPVQKRNLLPLMRMVQPEPLPIEDPFLVPNAALKRVDSIEKPKFPAKYVPREIPGFGVGQMREDGMIRSLRPDGTFMFSPEEAPADLDTPSGPDTLPEHGYPVRCKTSGRRIKLVYAAPVGYVATEMWEAVQLWEAIARANAKILLESMESSMLHRYAMPYVDCYPPGHELAGYPTISIIYVPGPTPSFADISNKVDISLGRPTGTSAVIHLIFFATQDMSADPAGGRGQVENGSGASKRTEQASRAWNRNTRNAVVYRAAWDQKTVVHEMFHSLGAIPDSFPDHWAASGNGHCLIQYDIMCSDSGPRGHLFPLAELCDDGGTLGKPIDCLGDLYFRAHEGDPTTAGADPASPNDWLDTHWNVIGRESKFFDVYPQWKYPDPCPTC